MLLNIENLHVSVENKEILKGIHLQIKPGEVHAVMGPNGSGKSTLASVLAGRDGYEITQGRVTYQSENLLELTPEARAHHGIFLAFQYPVEISGISNINFLKSSVNAVRKAQGKEPMDAMDFITYVTQKLETIHMSKDFLYRHVNEGFSGGEKKRNEILQMTVLEPLLAILDETDSGLDIDALKLVADGVNALRNTNRSFLVITHYQRLLDYIVPDYVHVLANGQIVKSGGKELALELEKQGYRWLDEVSG